MLYNVGRRIKEETKQTELSSRTCVWHRRENPKKPRLSKRRQGTQGPTCRNEASVFWEQTCGRRTVGQVVVQNGESSFQSRSWGQNCNAAGEKAWWHRQCKVIRTSGKKKNWERGCQGCSCLTGRKATMCGPLPQGSYNWGQSPGKLRLRRRLRSPVL